MEVRRLCNLAKSLYKTDKQRAMLAWQRRAVGREFETVLYTRVAAGVREDGGDPRTPFSPADYATMVSKLAGNVPQIDPLFARWWMEQVLGAGTQEIDEVFEEKDPTSSLLPAMDPLALASSLYGVVKGRLPDADIFARHWLRASADRLPEFCPRSLAMTVWSVASVSSSKESFRDEPSEKVLKAFRDLWCCCAAQKIEKFIPQGLANSLWALATMRAGTTDADDRARNSAREKMRRRASKDETHFLNLCLSELSARIQNGKCNPQDLANAIWAVARFIETEGPSLDPHGGHGSAPPNAPVRILEQTGSIDGEILQQFLGSWLPRASVCLEDFGEHTVIPLWALAKLYSAGIISADEHLLSTQTFLGSWLRIASNRKMLSRFSEQKLANSVWALATLRNLLLSEQGLPKGPPPASLVLYLTFWTEAALVKMSAFNAQCLANSLWAFATLELHPDDLVDDHVPPTSLLEEATSHAVVDGRSIERPSFLQQWLIRAKDTLPSFNGQNLANSIWALARIDREESPSWTRMTRSASSHEEENIRILHEEENIRTLPVDSHPPRGGEHDCYDDVLVEDGADETSSSVFGSSSSASSVVSAFSDGVFETSSSVAREFFEVFLAVSIKRMGTFSEQELGNIIWAVASLGVVDTLGLAGVAPGAAPSRRRMQKRMQKFLAVFAMKTAGQNLQPQGIVNVAWALAVIEDSLLDAGRGINQ